MSYVMYNGGGNFPRGEMSGENMCSGNVRIPMQKSVVRASMYASLHCQEAAFLVYIIRAMVHAL